MKEFTDSPADVASSGTLVVPALSASAGAEGHVLKGHMGTLGLMMSVLAFSAPVVVVAGFIPFVIQFVGPSAPLAYAVSLVLLLLFAVGFTTMSRFVANPGAFYSYITLGLGRRVGLGASFLAVAAYLSISVGTYAFFGSIASGFVAKTFAEPAQFSYGYAFACVLATGILGYLDISLSARILSFAMLCEIVIVMAFDFSVFKHSGWAGASLLVQPPGRLGSGAAGLGIVFAATCFLGFEATAVFRDEARDPQRTIPRATYGSIVSIGLFYVIAAWALLEAYGPEKAQAIVASDYKVMFANAVDRFMGPWASDLVVVLTITSAFACLLAVQNILARYFFSLGVDGVAPAAFGRVHSRFGSPHVSSLAVTVVTSIALAMAAWMDLDVASVYSLLAGAGGFAILVLMFLTSVAVMIFFRKNRAGVPACGHWRTAVAPILSVVSMGFVLFEATIHFDIMSGGSWVVSGALQLALLSIFGSGLLLATFLRSRNPGVYERIGRQ